MPHKRTILSLTGTRADFGKLKPLISAVEEHVHFDCHVFCTGMHQLKLYGLTAEEVNACGYTNVHNFMNQYIGEPMEMILANTIAGLSRYVEENRPDMLIVHGDRIEALAGAIVGMMKNILVAHIEGGERSGTVDEMLRHAISKLSHFHFVANEEAAARIRQMGEAPENVFVIGSPDIDAMCAPDLPSIQEVRSHYGINYEEYGIVMFHPVTTEYEHMQEYSAQFVQALIDHGGNYVVIYPNNDEGTQYILDAYKQLEGNSRFKVYPSIQFERFLTLLKHASFCIGNSSAGMRETPFYGIPTVNVGTRQQSRFKHSSIVDCGHETNDIVNAIARAEKIASKDKSVHFGEGDSKDKFLKIINSESFWQVKSQKRFFDISGVL